MASSDPPIHIVTPDGEKWNLCLSFAAKIIAAVSTTVVGALLIGAFRFAWLSNEALGKIDVHLAAIDKSIDTLADNTYPDREGSDNRERIERLERKHGL